MARYDAFVICTSPRSGSTLLCRLLAATGVAGQPDSYFHEPSLLAWLADYGLNRDDFASEHDALAAVFRAAIAEGSRDTGMFGLRLQRHSFDFFIDRLSALYPEPPTQTGRFEAAFGRTGFVYLRREDKAGQAISYVKAQQTGLWHRAPDGTELERLAPPAPPAYDGDRIAAVVAEMTAYDRKWEAWFADQGLSPLRITYDGLSAEPIGTLRTVLEHLGLDPEAARGVEPGTARLADQTTREWLARFRAERGAS